MDFLSKEYSNLVEVASQKSSDYQNAPPFPNIHFEKFFNPEFLDLVLEEFPDLSKGDSIRLLHAKENKFNAKGEQRFGTKTKAFMHFLNSEPFLNFLQELTGIEEKLMPDPYFIGGGQHELKPGGFLKIHADFNKHKPTGLDRRLNVLIYLNKNWKDEYGGHFELWDLDMENCVQKILPAFNTMAIFSTTDFSYHGNPGIVKCKEGNSRKSLALYYYTNGRPSEEINQGLEDHSTLFKARKGYGTDAEKIKNGYSLKHFVKDLLPPIITKGLRKLK